MKKRSAFISNSSSSSFICTISIVKDEEKFKQFEEEIGETFDRLTHEQLLQEIRYCGDFQDYLYGEKFENYKDQTFILDTDMQDVEEDPDGDTNYDNVELEDFCERSQKIFCADEEAGLENLRRIYCWKKRLRRNKK